MSFTSLLLLGISSIIINNYVLVRFMGICPFLGVSTRLKTAVGMGFAVTFVMTIASLMTYLLQRWILEPLHVNYLQTIAFILVIAALVQFVEMVLMKTSPVLYKALGVYLPLITTNCAVLGVTITNMDAGYNLLESCVSGFAGGLGFLVAIVLMAGIRERSILATVPKALRGFPIALITASLMALAFLGFNGMI